MSEHHTHMGLRNGRFHPGCSCRWDGEPTRWSSVAESQLNIHLTTVGQPTLPTERDVWARRYLGQRGGVA